MKWNQTHFKQRGTLFIAILVLLGATYFTAREVFNRVFLLSITQEILDDIASVKIETIGGIKATLGGTVTLDETEAFTYRNGERKLFYKAESVILTLNAFPGSTNNIELHRVDLEKPEIFLKRDKNGEWNATWAFQPRAKSKEPQQEEDELGKKNDETQHTMPPKESFPKDGINIHDGTLNIEVFTQTGASTNWVIDGVNATLKKEGATLFMFPFTGSFYGGAFKAKKAQFTPGEKRASHLQVSIIGAKLTELCSRLELDNKPKGTLDAVFAITKSVDRTDSHTIGAGQIEIRDADLWDLPLFMTVLSFLALDPISERKIEEAHLLFTIEKDRFRVDQMDFIGHPVSLFGEGEMDLAGEDLEVVFIPRLGKKGLDDMLPIIGTPIQWLLDIVKGAFVPLVLNGTFNDPDLSVKPGYNVAAPIRNLIKSKSK